MALKDIFKKKKTSSKKEENKDKKKTVKKVVKKVTPKKVVKSKKLSFEGFAYRVLKSPHITEKATILAENNQYVFIVYNDVNKIEIRKAVEALYDVKVIKVQIINRRKKFKQNFLKGFNKI